MYGKKEVKEAGEDASGISDSSGSESDEVSFADSFDQIESGLGGGPGNQRQTEIDLTSEVSSYLCVTDRDSVKVL